VRSMAIGINDDPLRLLEGPNQSVQKDVVKTMVAEFYAILVMLAKGVHRFLRCQRSGKYGGECPGDIELGYPKGESP
jgi:hypothetical protein